MKQKIITIMAITLFLMALILTLYPVISNYVNQKYASEIQTAHASGGKQRYLVFCERI